MPHTESVGNRASRPHHIKYGLLRLIGPLVLLGVIIPIVSVVTATPVQALANAVVPDSAISNFTPVQFPANDDGTYPCGGSGNAPPPCTGDETGPQLEPFGFNINFFGTEYSGAYINNNGNITLDAPLSTFTPFGLTDTSSVIIAPFFADVDTRVGNNVEFGTGMLNGYNVFVVNWPSVGCYSENDSVTDDFQLILFDRPDLGSSALGDDFQIEFNYDSMQWDAGQASGGNGECTDAPNSDSAVVGFANGSSVAGDSYQLPGSQESGAFLDSNASTGLVNNDFNSTTLGQYIFTVANGEPDIVNADLVNGNDYASPFTQSTLDLSSQSGSGDNLISIDPGAQAQTVDGFGATLTNSSAAVLESLPAASLNEILSELFNPQSGAGISVVRLSMGANDFSANGCKASATTCDGNYTYDDSKKGQSTSCPDPNLSNFSIFPYDQDIIDVLQAAEAINPNLTIIASPWTAPPWMKTGSPANDRYAGGSLKPTYYCDYAQYFVDYIDAYASQGITINYVTPQNEPGNNTTSYPGMVFTPTDEENFVDNYLSPALSDAGLTTQILDYDWNWDNVSKCNKDGGCWTTSDLDTVLNGAPANVAGLAWHCYTAQHGGSAEAQASFSALANFEDECTGTGSNGGSTGSGLETFQYNLGWDSTNLIVDGLENYASGVQFFNLALNQHSGPQNGGCTNCRGVVTINTKSSQVAYNVEYWILTLAANAFPPGDTVVSTTTPAGLSAVAATNTSDGQTGLYVDNWSTSPVPFTVDDAGQGFSYTIPAESAASFNWTS